MRLFVQRITKIPAKDCTRASPKGEVFVCLVRDGWRRRWSADRLLRPRLRIASEGRAAGLGLLSSLPTRVAQSSARCGHGCAGAAGLLQTEIVNEEPVVVVVFVVELLNPLLFAGAGNADNLTAANPLSVPDAVANVGGVEAAELSILANATAALTAKSRSRAAAKS